jgi:ABC-type uncharacterized transport system involved in gliding motility auxiliary subunit
MIKRTLDLFGWLGTTLVFAAVAVRFLKPEMEQLRWWLAMAGLACVLLFVLGQWREFVGMFSRRQARYGTLAGASVLIVLGILVAINYLSSRQNKRWDLTANKQFTLSEQTRKVLENLSAPINVKVFAREDDFDRFRSALNEYSYVSRQVNVEYVDLDKRPAVAKQYEVTSYGTVVFDYQGRVERAASSEEQDLTNALIKAVEGRQLKVYFVQGHGEKDTGSAERDGYNGISSALTRENFAAEKLVLAQQGDVPADASVVIVAGPRTDFFPPEIEAVRRYLQKGGKVLFMLDPPEQSDAPPLASIAELLKGWSVEFGTNVVVDVSGVGQLIGTDASVPVAANYPQHAITERFEFITAFPLARSVTAVAGGTEGRYAQVFIETSPRSWAETDITALTKTGRVAMEEAKGDKRGPISIGVAVSAPAPEAPAPKPEPAAAKPAEPDRKPETRVAVIGDSDFASNAFLGIQGNRDLFLNTVNWLAQQENLIAIRPREAEDRRVTLTADQQARIFWVTVLLIPGLVIAAGVASWWRRR